MRNALKSVALVLAVPWIAIARMVAPIPVPSTLSAGQQSLHAKDPILFGGRRCRRRQNGPVWRAPVGVVKLTEGD